MFQIDLKNRIPIYEQVVGNFKRMIMSGSLCEGTRVPSIRDMAKDLGVNPNTVQKAYRELENQGFFYTVLGQGSFIAAPPESATAREVAALFEVLAGHVRELFFRGVSRGEIITYIEELDVPKKEETVNGKN